MPKTIDYRLGRVAQSPVVLEMAIPTMSARTIDKLVHPCPPWALRQFTISEASGLLDQSQARWKFDGEIAFDATADAMTKICNLAGGSNHIMAVKERRDRALGENMVNVVEDC